MKKSIFRPIRIILLSSIGLVLITLMTMSWLSYREQHRLNQAGEALNEMLSFHEQRGLIEQKVVGRILGESDFEPHRLTQQIDELARLTPASDPSTRALLERLKRQLLQSDAPYSLQQNDQVIDLLHQIALSESRYEAHVITRLQEANDEQITYEMAAPLALFAFMLLAFPFARRRVVEPLESFGRQMSDLAEGEFTPIPEASLSDHTLPLHENFIKLAVRLQELEREQRERAESLEQEIRSASAALLEQQQSLARAERLAVAGELAASVAHEIRNPLAGIQMSLANLRHELQDPEFSERIDTIVSEVERLGHLVNEIVDAARHQPEPPTTTDVADLTDELISLTRYQLPASIELESRIRSPLKVRVPKERLRQALLNLILNSAAAIGETTGQIEIAIDQEDQTLRISVSDDGPGFPEELLSGGIHPFRSIQGRGTGLGLAMVRRFVRDSEGRMEIGNRNQSNSRPGACVTLLLPSNTENG
ncbi:MAG: ATP-binding protein [Myxococcota bacterium]|nr:ATP-binding protein [Myxococcota bacterium]